MSPKIKKKQSAEQIIVLVLCYACGPRKKRKKIPQNVPVAIQNALETPSSRGRSLWRYVIRRRFCDVYNILLRSWP